MIYFKNMFETNHCNRLLLIDILPVVYGFLLLLSKFFHASVITSPSFDSNNSFKQILSHTLLFNCTPRKVFESERNIFKSDGLFRLWRVRKANGFANT